MGTGAPKRIPELLRKREASLNSMADDGGATKAEHRIARAAVGGCRETCRKCRNARRFLQPPTGQKRLLVGDKTNTGGSGSGVLCT